jgi:hypothetical protein
MTAETISRVPWWKEPTRDQWYAWWAAWLGWTLDALHDLFPVLRRAAYVTGTEIFVNAGQHVC